MWPRRKEKVCSIISLLKLYDSLPTSQLFCAILRWEEQASQPGGKGEKETPGDDWPGKRWRGVLGLGVVVGDGLLRRG